MIREDDANEEMEIQLEDLVQNSYKFEDSKLQVHDSMEEVNLDTVLEPRVTYISSLLPLDLNKEIITIL